MRVNELFFSFCPVTTPCKGEAASLLVAAKSRYEKKGSILPKFGVNCSSILVDWCM